MMDTQKVGQLIAQLRRERGMTQKELADMLHLSDRTVSKWECGAGCPDVSLLGALSDVFGVQIEGILSGDMARKRTDGGNLRHHRFYRCKECGNVVFSASAAQIGCCGRSLEPLMCHPADAAHTPKIALIDTESYATWEHPMSKAEHLSFVALVQHDSVHMVKLYPEQSAAARLPYVLRGTLYMYCTKDGLMQMQV